MIEKLNLKRPGGRTERELFQEIEEKINELVEAANKHTHTYGQSGVHNDGRIYTCTTSEPGEVV